MIDLSEYINKIEFKINVVAVYRFIRKYLLHKRDKIMCFKKWFGKPDPIVPDPPQDGQLRLALLFAINDYPGYNNDLRGCLNDQINVANKLDTYFAGFDIKRFKDSECTRYRFTTEVDSAISKLKSGDILLIHYSGHGTQVYDPHGDEADGYDEAIFLYDGTVIDDNIKKSLDRIPEGAVVVLMFDSCFSGTITRVIKDEKTKERYFQNPTLSMKTIKKHRIPKSEMKWIVFSGCREDQTSADAYIEGNYHGAFTFYAMKTLVPGITYSEWLTNIKKYLPSSKFEQEPTLEGKEDLFSRIVFK